MATTADIVKGAYDLIGVAKPDAEGVAYWTQQLESGAITPAQKLQPHLTWPQQLPQHNNWLPCHSRITRPS